MLITRGYIMWLLIPRVWARGLLAPHFIGLPSGPGCGGLWVRKIILFPQPAAISSPHRMAHRPLSLPSFHMPSPDRQNGLASVFIWHSLPLPPTVTP